MLIDTGLHEPGAMRQLERALDQAGMGIEHVRLLVCTHAHSDHYGLAAPIERSGCELWMHPNHAHMTKAAQDPERAFERRFEVARQRRAGVAGGRGAGGARDQGFGIAEIVMPDRDLVPGVTVDTDLGVWNVYETPGHAPSHGCCTSPSAGCCCRATTCSAGSRSTTTTGTRPAGGAASLDVVDELDVQLVLAGHGRPVRALADRGEPARGPRAHGPGPRRDRKAVR